MYFYPNTLRMGFQRPALPSVSSIYRTSWQPIGLVQPLRQAVGSRSLENGIPIAVEDSELPVQLRFSQMRKQVQTEAQRQRVAWLTPPRKGGARLRQDPGVLSSFPHNGEDFPSASLQPPLTFLFAHTHSQRASSPQPQRDLSHQTQAREALG